MESFVLKITKIDLIHPINEILLYFCRLALEYNYTAYTYTSNQGNIWAKFVNLLLFGFFASVSSFWTRSNATKIQRKQNESLHCFIQAMGHYFFAQLMQYLNWSREIIFFQTVNSLSLRYKYDFLQLQYNDSSWLSLFKPIRLVL